MYNINAFCKYIHMEEDTQHYINLTQTYVRNPSDGSYEYIVYKINISLILSVIIETFTICFAVLWLAYNVYKVSLFKTIVILLFCLCGYWLFILSFYAFLVETKVRRSIFFWVQNIHILISSLITCSLLWTLFSEYFKLSRMK